MNGDLLYVDAWLGDGPTLAGLATRYVRLRRTREPVAATPLEEAVFDECAGTVTTLCHLAGRELPFDGQAPFGFSYEWLRCDAEGNWCSVIVGMTEAKYTLDADDVGSTEMCGDIEFLRKCL